MTHVDDSREIQIHQDINKNSQRNKNITKKFNEKSNGKSFIQLAMELQDVPQASVQKFHNRCLNGRVWCIKDICGLVCAFFTWGLILYAE